jgi:hypothetical protein
MRAEAARIENGGAGQGQFAGGLWNRRLSLQEHPESRT